MKTRVLRNVVVGVAVLASAILVGPAPAASAAEVYVTDFHIWWPDLVWKPGECQSVTFNWQALTPTLQVTISTRTGQGRPVNMSGGKYPYTTDESLGIGIPIGGSGHLTRTICGPASAAEAKDMQLWAERDMYTSQAGGVKEAWRPLYAAVDEPAPGAPGNVAVSGADRTAHVTWSAPSVNGQFLASFKVLEAATGATVCEVDKAVFSCDAANLADGPHSFIVWTLNASGGGTASPPTAAINVAAPAPPPAPSLKKVGKNVRVTWSTDNGSTARPTGYRVLNQRGRQECAVTPSPDDLFRGFSTCTVRKPKKGTQFQVIVTTALGTATSPLSKPVR